MTTYTRFDQNAVRFVTLLATDQLALERVLTAGAGIGIQDNGAGSTVVISSTVTGDLLRSVAAAGSSTVLAGMSRYIADDFEIGAAGVLELASDAIMEIG